ncbi:hypothetical protein CPB86DRAFT_873895 [Serendipita vermifera]|nr:hypothetical protein CPB86DRAFT_873895 [Serendipita vermifera]
MSSIVPAQHLPPELLGPIMETAFDNGMDPFHLCHVCRHWRYIAQGIKRFWNEILIELVDEAKALLYPTCEHLNALIELSRDELVTIRIGFMPVSILAKTIRDLAQYSWDIRSLSLCVEIEKNYSQLIGALQGSNFPVLTSLSLEQYGEDSEGVIQAACNLLMNSFGEPLELRMVCHPTPIMSVLEKHRLFGRISSLNVNFSSTYSRSGLPTDFQYRGGTLSNVRSFVCNGIVRCLDFIATPEVTDMTIWSHGSEWSLFRQQWLGRKLQRLSLRNLVFDHRRDPAMTPRHYIHLRWLYIHQVTVVPDIRTYLHLPNLQTLRFETWKHASQSFSQESDIYLSDVLTRDGIFGDIHKLQNLRIDNVPFRRDYDSLNSFSQVLGEYNDMRSLHIKNCDIPTEFLSLLLETNGIGCFVGLTELHFDQCRLEHKISELRTSLAAIRPDLRFTAHRCKESTDLRPTQVV